MKRTACQYAIVRFAPFVETGEFANVGILMMAPQVRFFGFKLETRRFGRITRFFEELDRRHYLQALRRLHEELVRVEDMLKAHGFDRRYKNVDEELAQSLFAEIVRPRESTIRFSEPRVVLAIDPAAKLDELFRYYVERSFVSKEYTETLLEKSVRRWLISADLANRFRAERVGDSLFHMQFPFVELKKGRPVKIIKPLDLGLKEPTKILEKGGFWKFRIQEFQRRKKLPERVLFAVAGPDRPSNARLIAFNESVSRLVDSGVEVVAATNRNRVVEFAGE